ncbi:MAG: anaerobic ribonucleoside-triphosphate reductase activating protein [Anaerolineae bacterium]|nr:anaerobic ribonucleoside-triphosphate reductase activating protein [Anaerolineae bacterium]
MQTKGWVKTSLIDFPDHIATVVFTGGCSFRCPMCHNAALVLSPDAVDDIPETELLAFLEQRAGLIDGLVITGGEPTLQTDLAAFIRTVKRYPVDVKLDTNGYHPKMLAALLEEDLVDFVAMDVKAPPERYALLAGRETLDLGRIERSLALLGDSGLPYELRTTVVPGLLEEADIETLASWLASRITKRARYVLQQFRGGHTLDSALTTLTPYTSNRLRVMADSARRRLPDVRLRGI